MEHTQHSVGHFVFGTVFLIHTKYAIYKNVHKKNEIYLY